MKKAICLLLVVVMSLGLVACGKKQEETTTEEAFKPSMDTSTKCQIKIAGGYDNFEALETEFDHDAYEISMNEYYQYLIDGEDDKVAEDYDEDGNTVYYYYNSKTAKQNYILIEIDGEELKVVGKTSFEPKDIDDIYHYPYLDVTGFVVYDDYLYIFSSRSLVESFPLKDIK